MKLLEYLFGTPATKFTQSPTVVARPFNPTFARLVQASVVMDTTDMTFDASGLRRKFPELALASVAEAARRDYVLDQQAVLQS